MKKDEKIRLFMAKNAQITIKKIGIWASLEIPRFVTSNPVIYYLRFQLYNLVAKFHWGVSERYGGQNVESHH